MTQTRNYRYYDFIHLRRHPDRGLRLCSFTARDLIGFAGLFFASFMAWMIVALPSAPFWHNQQAYEIAFGSAWRVFYGSGIIPDNKLPLVMGAQFVAKVGVEVVFTPLTYKIVAWLKKAEKEDYYDRDTDFNPFTLKT